MPHTPETTLRTASAERALGIPVRCAARPRRSGLVVPWISYAHGERVAFGSIDPIRRHQAFLTKLCQVCGQRLEERICLVVRPMDARVGYAPEPGLHPECLVMSKKQCPMLNGSAAAYRSSPLSRHPAGRPCTDPACSCPELASDDSHQVRAGRPADAFEAWMIAAEHYRLTPDPDHRGAILGVDLRVPVLRVRPIREAAGPRLSREEAERMLAALRALGL